LKKTTLLLSIIFIIFTVLTGFIVFEDPFGSKSEVSDKPTVNNNPTVYVSPDGVALFVDSLNGANDTNALRSRGYLIYQESQPVGSSFWFQGNPAVFTAFNGPTSGYVGANYNATSGVGQIDVWLVMPRITGGGLIVGDSLYFYSRSPLNSIYPDSIRVMYSTTDSTPSGTWTELERFKVNTDSSGWQLKGFRAPTANANARFAIRYNVADGGPSGTNSNYIGIDAISIVRTGTVTQSPQYFNHYRSATGNNFPFNTAAGKAVNHLILPGEINKPVQVPAGKQITKVYILNASNAVGVRTYSNLHILLAQDTITGLSMGVFYPGPYDTVFYRDTITIETFNSDWMCFTLDHPFFFDPTKSLIIFVGQCGATGSGGQVYNASYTPLYRRVWSVGGCPFVPYTTSSDGSVFGFGIDVESATGNTNITTVLPSEYKLAQNYPNPFNPVTSISYSIPSNGFVTLKVYDMLGREVSSLVNSMKTAGNYTVEFNASGLSSGIYFYRIEVNGFKDVKKMMLIK